jgi:hypothetical protein
MLAPLTVVMLARVLLTLVLVLLALMLVPVSGVTLALERAPLTLVMLALVLVLVAGVTLALVLVLVAGVTLARIVLTVVLEVPLVQVTVALIPLPPLVAFARVPIDVRPGPLGHPRIACLRRAAARAMGSLRRSGASGRGAGCVTAASGLRSLTEGGVAVARPFARGACPATSSRPGFRR